MGPLLRFQPNKTEVKTDNRQADKGRVGHDDSTVIDIVGIESIEKSGAESDFPAKQIEGKEIKKNSPKTSKKDADQPGNGLVNTEAFVQHGNDGIIKRKLVDKQTIGVA
jgi:hypothetical protein